MTVEPDWTVAACRGADTATFYPTHPRGKYVAEVADRWCQRCPIQRGCLEWAAANSEQGIWGGVHFTITGRYGVPVAAFVLDVLRGANGRWVRSVDLTDKVVAAANCGRRTVTNALTQLKGAGVIERRGLQWRLKGGAVVDMPRKRTA